MTGPPGKHGHSLRDQGHDTRAP